MNNTILPNKEEALISIIKNIPEIMETLSVCKQYGLSNFYIAGGAITQILWNTLLKKAPLYKVKDFDIVYFSKEEPKEKVEDHQQAIVQLLSHSIDIDLVNQAYTHEWYGKKFGNTIQPFTSVEDAIQCWLSAFAIGITFDDTIKVYAPYGLEDAFSMHVKPNKRIMNQKSYETMTKSYKKRWREITVFPWST